MMKHRIKFILLIGLSLVINFSNAQDSTSTLTPEQVKKRTKIVAYSSAGLYAASLVGMYELWYKNSENTSWHFFNDNAEWKQMDKVGHFYFAFHMSRAGTDIFKWTGIDRKKAIWYGGLLGFGFQTTIEILDGFQKEYGASWGDLLANTAGSFGVIAQELAWDEIRIMPKFSYHPSPYAHERPNTLGSTWNERMLKDYNGQTYWLSFDLYAFMKESSFPKWLNVAMGYSANGMVYGRDQENIANGFNPYRQYYLGIDIDLSHIKTKSKFLNTCIYLLSTVKLPAPAIEMSNKNGFRFHPLYF